MWRFRLQSIRVRGFWRQDVSTNRAIGRPARSRCGRAGFFSCHASPSASASLRLAAASDSFANCAAAFARSASAIARAASSLPRWRAASASASLRWAKASDAFAVSVSAFARSTSVIVKRPSVFVCGVGGAAVPAGRGWTLVVGGEGVDLDVSADELLAAAADLRTRTSRAISRHVRSSVLLNSPPVVANTTQCLLSAAEKAGHSFSICSRVTCSVSMHCR